MTEASDAVEAAHKLIQTTERMANEAVMDMHLWNVHSNAALTVARAFLAQREALEEIARQELTADMGVDDQLGGDFEGAYDWMIERARAALLA